MQCPADHSLMQEMTLENIHVDVCPTCSGVWLDADEMRPLVLHFTNEEFDETFKRWEAIEKSGISKPSEFWKEEKRVCPKDASKLKKHYFAGDSGIGIDYCMECRGFWIDGEEIKELYTYNKQNAHLDSGIRLMIRDSNDMRKMLEDAQQLPARIASTAILAVQNPFFALYLIANAMMQLIVEEVRESGKM